MHSDDVERILASLKGFQRDAVEHVVDRLYGPDADSGRFLVADETGLGKSIVARGVVAASIAKLQDAAHVERIDVVYICSSTDLAKQNLRRLNVTGDPHIGITSRLTLLALESSTLSAGSALGGRRSISSPSLPEHHSRWVGKPDLKKNVSYCMYCSMG